MLFNDFPTVISNDIITELLRILSLVNRCVWMRVCKHLRHFRFVHTFKNYFRVQDTQCFEYSDEIEEDEGTCGECKELVYCLDIA